ncbi:MAG: tetratricopeptide repeat protein [Bacteroidaceae bacterium]|nr:tetratricopeptide repeat protein [Bacteroidaceae bacterium]
MRLRAWCILVCLACQMPWVCHAYSDHRNRKVDSLENVLKTKQLEPEELARVYDQLMNGYLQTNEERSIMYAKKGLELAGKHDFRKLHCDSWRIIGLHAYGNASYDSAQHCFQRALDGIEQLRGDKRYDEVDIDDELSMLYGTMGNLYNIQGQLHLALDYYQKALPIFKKHEWKQSETLLYYNVGELYLELGNNKAAEENYKNAYEVALTTHDSLMVATASSGLAMSLLNDGKREDALRFAHKSLEYFNNHKDEEVVAVLDGYVLISRIYLEGYDDIGKAQEYMEKALELTGEIDAPTNLSDAYLLQADILLRRHDGKGAVAWGQKALEANDQDPQHNIGVYLVLAKAYAALGDAEQAQTYITKLHRQMEEQSTGKYQSALSEMEVRYQTLEKEAELKELEQQQRITRIYLIVLIVALVLVLAGVAVFFYIQRQRHRMARMQARLAGEAEERTRLGRDLHDRLGGLLTAIRMKTDGTEVSDLSMQATEEMRRIAHHLMPASLKDKGLVTALRDFCRVHPTVKFSFHGMDDRLPEQHEVVVYCAVHEMVNNALKYAEASHIMVQLMMDEEYVAVIVADNGKGFDTSAHEEGMGIHNIRERVEMLDGRLSISSSPSGTEVNIELPR